LTPVKFIAQKTELQQDPATAIEAGEDKKEETEEKKSEKTTTA